MFRVYLPPHVAGEEPAATPVAAVRTPRRGAGTILIAEDDEGLRSLVATMLRQSGYVALEAADGEHAIEIATTSAAPIHLLLTDVVMPGMSGRVLSERMAAIRPDTRVLFMSGYAEDAMLRHGVNTAGRLFLQKPFAMDVLTARVREALGTRTVAELVPPPP